jgi:hypothetical protein
MLKKGACARPVMVNEKDDSPRRRNPIRKSFGLGRSMPNTLIDELECTITRKGSSQRATSQNTVCGAWFSDIDHVS